jgi:hypothetical protein
MMDDDLYVVIWQTECSICGTGPTVAIRTPSGQLAATGFCGSHFFGDRLMSDHELWNQPREETE